jgi:hypothetical protein
MISRLTDTPPVGCGYLKVLMASVVLRYSAPSGGKCVPSLIFAGEAPVGAGLLLGPGVAVLACDDFGTWDRPPVPPQRFARAWALTGSAGGCITGGGDCQAPGHPTGRVWIPATDRLRGLGLLRGTRLKLCATAHFCW